MLEIIKTFVLLHVIAFFAGFFAVKAGILIAITGGGFWLHYRLVPDLDSSGMLPQIQGWIWDIWMAYPLAVQRSIGMTITEYGWLIAVPVSAVLLSSVISFLIGILLAIIWRPLYIV